MAVAAKIRAGGAKVDLMQEVTKKVAKAFNYADRVGAHRIAFVAPDEYSKGLVRIKDLRLSQDLPDDQKQKDVPIAELHNIDSFFGA